MSLNIPNGEHWTPMAIHSHFSKKSEPSKKFHQFSSSNHIRIDRTRTPHSQRAKGVEGRFDRSVLYSAQNMRERGTKRNITGSKHTEKISLMLLPTTKENVMSLFIDRLFLCTVLTHEHIFSEQQERRKAADVHFCSKTTLIYASQPTGIM